LIRAIVFDFDGLTVDTETAWYQAFSSVLAERGVHLPLARFLQVVGTDDGPLHDFFREALGQDCDVKAIEDAAAERYREIMMDPRPREGVLDYLEDAAEMGLKVGMASSSGASWVGSYLDRLGIGGCFHAVVTREQVQRVKPAPDLYVRALELLQVEPHEALAFEDSLNGLLAARRAGLRCVVVPNRVTESLPFEGHALRLSSMGEMSLSQVISAVGG
jgi:putative hydrolase of the HAD superfamily